MFAVVSCPACQYKFSIPEGDMGKRYVCPNCKSPFLAGKSVAEAAEPAPLAGAPQPSYAKTMLGETAPPIKYNCPNCKKPFESPASEAGTKKNCSACGQRFQIPAASPATPTLNKTILASDESKTAVQPGYQPVPGTAPLPTGQMLPAPTPFTPRNLAIAAVVLLLLLITVPAFMRGGKVEDRDALAKAQLELEKLKLEIAAREKELAQQKAADEETRKKLFDKMEAYIREQDAKTRDAEAQLKWEKQKREMEAEYQKLLEKAKAGLDEKQRALEAAQQAQQKTQTIIQQPPVVVYPPYHPRYYWPWGW